ncbi:type I phosphomannose isomerase catalytic subunit [Paenibacillus sp. PL2-23]|uniref:type I phosphomannose isomerase catalytic subunit n=1 Tax=Paenibacillus sp. PL2-23 TaxID=2100729 RepID=UPI0030F78A4C
MTTDQAQRSKRPLKLRSNRVWRTYTGGKQIEDWQGRPNAQDSAFPEEWVASAVKAKNAGREHIVEGWSLVEPEEEGGAHIALKDLVESDPAAYLGPKHATRYKEQMAVLVKVLDAGERLTIQVHPSRETAKELFDSEFGKTEAWYVLGGREIDGEAPCIYLGFKPGMTKERWRELFESQAIPDMLDSLHRIPVKKGDVFLVEGGVPHAIGAGCFLVEIQEPTDLTLRTERITPSGLHVPDASCHQGIGFEAMLDCFRYESLDLPSTLARYKKEPRLLRSTEGGRETMLIGSEDTDRFSMNLLQINGPYARRQNGGFSIAIVVQGSGELYWGQERMPVRQGDQFFFPAGLEAVTWVNADEQAELKVVVCHPPEVKTS